MKSEFLQCAEQKIAIDRRKCFLDVYLGTTHLRLLGILVELSHEFVGQENIVNNATPLNKRGLIEADYRRENRSKSIGEYLRTNLFKEMEERYRAEVIEGGAGVFLRDQGD